LLLLDRKAYANQAAQANQNKQQTDCSELPEFQQGKAEVHVSKQQTSSRSVRAKLSVLIFI
jgi:hypothetical protein